MQNFIRHSEIKNFLISLFSIAQIWGWRVTIFFWQFMVDILPLGSVDPHIFTDPDPKHSLAPSILTSFMNKIRSNPFYPKGPIIIEYKNKDSEGAKTARDEVRSPCTGGQMGIRKIK